MENAITIIPYSPSLKEYVKILNFEWLNKYFKVEPKDEILLSNPQGEIIDKGGIIFYAKLNDKIVGTVSLIKIDDTTFELGKMAVSDSAQGFGIGNKLMERSLSASKSMGIKKLILYSNRILLPALHLYRKYGFVEIPLGTSEYERSNIKMEKII